VGVPSFGRSRRTAVASSLGVLTLAVVGAVGTYVSARHTEAVTFPGVIQPLSQSSLGFSSPGTLATVDVQVGDFVHPGQVLATESSTILSEQALEQKAVLVADEAVVVALEDPTASASQQARLAAALSAAQQQLGSAQQVSGAAVSASGAALSRDQEALTNAESVLSHAQATYAANCPNGTTPPPGYVPGGPPPAKGTGPSPQQVSQYLSCVAMSNEIVSDQSAVGNDQAAVAQANQQLAQVKAQAAQQVGTAQDNLDVRQAGLAAAASQSDAVQLAEAKSVVAKDAAALQLDEAELQATVLRAPAEGVVVSIPAAVGSIVGPTVERGSGSTNDPFPAASSPSFFPVQPSSPSAGSTAATGVAPVVTLDLTGAWRAAAEVPEDAIPTLRPGQAATVRVDTDGAVLHGEVLSIEPQPLTVGSATYYEVLVGPAARRSTSLPAGVLPGMTASITIPH